MAKRRKYRDVFLKAGTAFVGKLPSVLRAAGVRSLTGPTGLISVSAAGQIEEIGHRLFKSLVKAPVARRLRMQPGETGGTRVWIELQDPLGDAQPWELLCDRARGAGTYLACDRQTPVLRTLKRPSASTRLRDIDGPLRILGVIAAPQGRPALNVQKERKALEKALKTQRALDLVEIDWITGRDTAVKLVRRLRETWHIVHFIGHGDFEPAIKSGVLAFEDEQGREHRIGGAALRNVLSGTGVRLVVLNACRGAYTGHGGLFTSIAARLAQAIPAVVAMQTAITDRSAIAFSDRFYESLVEGIPIDLALTETRVHLQSLPSRGAIEWPAPVLYLSTTDDILKIKMLKGPAAPPKTAASTRDTAAAPKAKRRRTAGAKRKHQRVASERVLSAVVATRQPRDPADPQKGRWGQSPEANGRRLSAKVESVDKDWYRIKLMVKSSPGHAQLKGQVHFHLHDSFKEPIRTVSVRNGKATLSLVAFGAFTVGVEADGGKTRLELDLSELADAPKGFREN